MGNKEKISLESVFVHIHVVSISPVFHFYLNRSGSEAIFILYGVMGIYCSLQLCYEVILI